MCLSTSFMNLGFTFMSIISGLNFYTWSEVLNKAYCFALNIAAL